METEEDGTAAGTKKKEKVDELELEVKNTGNLLSAQRTAIEVLSNICIPEEEDVDETMEDSESESVHDYDVSSSQNGNCENMDSLPVEVLEAIKSLGIVEKVFFSHSSVFFIIFLFFPALEPIPITTRKYPSNSVNHIKRFVQTTKIVENLCPLVSPQSLHRDVN